MNHADKDIFHTLNAAARTRRQANLWRELRVPAFDLNFCSNDYLGLSRHPEVVAAFSKGLKDYGCGSGGSALVSGYQRPHHELSERLAAWLGRESVLLCPSGYAANHAAVAALSDVRCEFIFDKSCHASMYDAVQHCGAPLQRYPHNQTERLQKRLQVIPDPATELRIIGSEGVFSMDGDTADLTALIAARNLNPNAKPCWLWLDDAHALGVCGEQGRGIGGMASADEVRLLSATFGKALGIGGAFFAADKVLTDAAIQHTRHVIFSTSFSAAQALAIDAALTVLIEEPHHRQQLEQRINQFKQGLYQLGWRSESDNERLNHAIQPVVCGDNALALRMSQHLLQHGIFCRAIRPPTVAPGKAQLRFTINATHSEREINRVLEVLGSAKNWLSEQENEHART